jgi:hypothetical protein
MGDVLDNVVIPALGLLTLGLWLYLSHALTKVVKRLKDNYPILWDSLGRPPAPVVFAGVDVLIMLSFAKPAFTRWLASKEYAKLRDATIDTWVFGLKSALHTLIGVLTFAVCYAAVRLVGSSRF